MLSKNYNSSSPYLFDEVYKIVKWDKYQNFLLSNICYAWAFKQMARKSRNQSAGKTPNFVHVFVTVDNDVVLRYENGRLFASTGQSRTINNSWSICEAQGIQ